MTAVQFRSKTRCEQEGANATHC